MDPQGAVSSPSDGYLHTMGPLASESPGARYGARKQAIRKNYRTGAQKGALAPGGRRSGLGRDYANLEHAVSWKRRKIHLVDASSAKLSALGEAERIISAP